MAQPGRGAAVEGGPTRRVCSLVSWRCCLLPVAAPPPLVAGQHLLGWHPWRRPAEAPGLDERHADRQRGGRAPARPRLRTRRRRRHRGLRRPERARVAGRPLRRHPLRDRRTPVPGVRRQADRRHAVRSHDVYSFAVKYTSWTCPRLRPGGLSRRAPARPGVADVMHARSASRRRRCVGGRARLPSLTCRARGSGAALEDPARALQAIHVRHHRHLRHA